MTRTRDKNPLRAEQPDGNGSVCGAPSPLSKLLGSSLGREPYRSAASVNAPG